jgi:hypothetical protein
LEARTHRKRSALIVVVLIARIVVVGRIVFGCVIDLRLLVAIAEANHRETGQAGDLEAAGVDFGFNMRLADFEKSKRYGK